MDFHVILLGSTNLRHLPRVIHGFCSAKAARRTLGPQILTRMLVLIVTGFRGDVRSREERYVAAGRLSGEQERSQESREERNGRRERELEGATHPEDWTTWRESGTIYMGAPPQSRSAPQEARPAHVSSRLSSRHLAHRSVRDDTNAVNKPLGDPTCWQST